MRRPTLFRVLAFLALATSIATAQSLPDDKQVAQERAQAAASANLPAACCDAIFLRHVYHHIIPVEAFNASLLAALKPGGRLAIIDFVPDKGSKLPEGVPANRGGHGVPPSVVIDEMKAAGLAHVRTIDKWPPGDKNPAGFLTLFTAK